MDEQQMDLRFRNRRRIALASFILMSVMLLVLIFLSIAFDGIAERVANIQWLVGTAAGLWSTLTLGYYAAASYEQGRVK